MRTRTTALAAILAAAAALRLMALGTNPPALFRDEAEKGYTAWSIAKMGGYVELDPHDATPRFHRWPLFIRTPGAVTSATYQYFDAPFTGLFGLNEWAIRLPAALAGIAGVGLCFLAANAVTGDRRAALLAAGLLAVSPWHVVFSRWAAQGIFVPLFVSAGVWLFWAWREKPSEPPWRPSTPAWRPDAPACRPDAPACRRGAWLRWPAAALLFGAAAYTYDPARLTVPLLAVAMAACGFSEIRRRWGPATAAAIVFMAVMAPLIVFQMAGGAERLGRVSIFAEGISLWTAAGLFARNYGSHFSPVYLFVSGDQELRHSLPGFGQLLHVEAPLFVAGVIAMLRRRQREDWFVLLWFLLGPLPAALTNEAPHALRSIAALPSPAIISAIGFFAVWDWGRRHGRLIPYWTLTGVTMLIVGVELAAMVFTLFVVYPEQSAPNWQFGLKQALFQVRERTPKGQAPPFVFVSSQIPFAPCLALAYEQTDPRQFREKGLEALRPIAFLPSPEANEEWSQRAPAGSWFVLTPHERPSGRPETAVFFPSLLPPDEPESRRPALLLYRKP